MASAEQPIAASLKSAAGADPTNDSSPLVALDRDFAELAHIGYEFSGARETLLLHELRKAPEFQPPFELQEVKVNSDMILRTGTSIREAKVKVLVQDEVQHVVSEGSGPVHALDNALRKALLPQFPALEAVHLSDYQVTIVDPNQATAAKTRVLIEATNGNRRWCTLGVSNDIIEASALALSDSYEYFLLTGSDEGSDASVQ